MEVTMVFTLGVLVLRLGLLAAGVLFCWFGYRLFSQTSSHGAAELSIRDTLKLNFQHVGPGVFFSLFGASILIYSIHSPPKLDAMLEDGFRRVGTASSSADPPVPNKVVIAGARSDQPGLDDRARLLQVGNQIAFLNRLAAAGEVPQDDRTDLPRLAREIKLSLMRSIWTESWGDYVTFSDWARGTSSVAPPAEASKLFNQ
jgi:hypothetical protein